LLLFKKVTEAPIEILSTVGEKLLSSMLIELLGKRPPFEGVAMFSFSQEINDPSKKQIRITKKKRIRQKI
jgi:hypothetical protein